jgi:hypothetical protein
MVVSARPASLRGVRVVTNVDAGYDGRFGFARRAEMRRTAKSRGSGPPTLGSSSQDRLHVELAGDGGYQARTPGRARISRKTIVQGKPACFRLNLWSYPRAFYCTGPTGAIGARLSLRPLVWAAPDVCKTRTIMSRERNVVSAATRRPEGGYCHMPHRRHSLCRKWPNASKIGIFAALSPSRSAAMMIGSRPE